MTAISLVLVVFGGQRLKLKSLVRYGLKAWLPTPGCDCDFCQMRRGKKH
jgi:hypothetical protein